jgi:putative flippase GtrA
MQTGPKGSKLRELARQVWQTDLKSFSLIGIGLLLGGWIFIFLTTHLGITDKDTANGIQAILSVLLNPVLNRKFTWGGRNTSKWRIAWRYGWAKVVTVAINLFVFSRIADYTIGYAFSNVLIMALNYPIMRSFVYGEGGFWQDVWAIFEQILSWVLSSIRFILRAERATYNQNPPDSEE